MKKKRKGIKGFLSFSQIFLLVLSIISFSIILNQELGFVSGSPSTGGDDEQQTTNSQEDVRVAGPYKDGDVSPRDSTEKGDDKKIDTGLLSLVWNKFQKNTALKNFGYSIVAYSAVRAFGSMFNIDDDTTEAIGRGTSAYFFTQSAIGENGWALKLMGKEGLTFLGAHTATILSLGAGIVIAAVTYKSQKKKVVTFDCVPWDATTGGNNCEMCNKQGPFSCSEYQCKSLGQGCELIEGRCVWVNEKDKTYPVMSLWQDILNDDYKYSNNNAISPPNKGVEISTKEGQCLKAFTPFAFGVVTNENAKCRIDIERKDSFSEMKWEMSRQGFNHSIILSIPDNASLSGEDPTIQIGKESKYYVRCQDYNGNENPAEFVFSFCVEQGPVLEPPIIVTTSIEDNGYIGYGEDKANLVIGVDKPSECRWSTQDKDYDDMENNMACSESVFEMNLQMLYSCETTLTGLKDREENKFYFRCKSFPLKEESLRKENSQSYEFTLKGTEELKINEVEPENETIKDSTEDVKVTLKVKTAAGAENGKARCYYSKDSEDKGWLFYNTNSYEHSQDIFETEGSYTYYITCEDAGGNTDKREISFNVESDNNSPVVVRAYNEENSLKIITNEKAECVYDKKSCEYNFDDGIKMTSPRDKEFFADWNTNIIYYIKCRDEYGNQPSQNQCSMKIRATDF